MFGLILKRRHLRNPLSSEEARQTIFIFLNNTVSVTFRCLFHHLSRQDFVRH